jgi:hypothetical protein
MSSLWLGLAAAMAQEPAAEPPPAPDPRIEELEKRIDKLETDLEAQRQAALIAEAEALAGAPSPVAAPTQQRAQLNAFNPRITAFGEVFASAATEGGELNPSSGPWMRSLELDIRADVDPFAKAVAILAFEQEDPIETGEHGEFGAEPEEVYADLVALPYGFAARVGKFRQPFGIVNRTHPHDLPWSDVPLAPVTILGEEGWNDTGVTASWRTLIAGAALTLEGGATRGDDFYDEDTGSPAWLGRVELFRTFGRLDVGLGGTGAGGADRTVGGGDLMVKWRANQWRSVVLVAEALADDAGTTGGYAALQVQPTRPLYLGVRGDLVSSGDGTADARRVSAFVSAYTSEFLRLRAGVGSDGSETRGDVQLTFVWGSHPAEPYWVNR